MKLVFINNSSETFTPTESGAISTWIWEVCQAARRGRDVPVVITRSSVARRCAWPATVAVDYPSVPSNALLQRLLRAERKLTGWRHLSQQRYASRVARAIRREKLEGAALCLHNDPEMAVSFRRRFPSTVIMHHFHNQLDCRPRFRAGFAGAANVVTAVSDFTARWVENYYALKPGSVRTIYNGVDSERFRPAEDAATAKPILNFLGRTGIEKAPDLLLRAAREVASSTKDFEVQILGSNHWQKFEEDDYQRLLNGLADDLAGEGIRVRRPGHVDRRNLPGELRRAHIHVFTSRWDEPFGLATLEGMASGLATVASRTGGTPEVVGDAALLFERDSVPHLAEQLRALIVDRDLRACYAQKARQRAGQFRWERTWRGIREAAGF